MKHPFLSRAAAFSRRPLVITLSFAGALSLSLAGACAPGSEVPPGTPGATSGQGSGQGGSGGDIFGTGTGPTDGGLDPDAACGVVSEKATSTPLNLYIAFDKSSSMVGNKWDSARAGLDAFVNDPNAAGIRVALNFFPKQGGTCDQFGYKEPLVAFDYLPMNAKPITDAINAAMPDGTSTPIYPALGGALLKGIEVVENTPGDAAAVLLVTDGLPQGPAPMCSGVNPEDPQVIADLAATGASYKPSVKTFVIGLPGVDQTFANKVAMAGGTGSAILIGAANVKAEFQAALEKVRGTALPCEFEMPAQVEGGEFDPGFVNVEVTPGSGKPAVIPQDPSCKGAGWHYDDPVNPTKIVFCPTSCQAIKSDFNAKVQILLGCQTEIAN